MWDADQYLKFADERARPFFDLLAQVRQEQPALIADLGCGTGHLTRTLAERWPAAKVVGVDNSASMLKQARPIAMPGRLEFVEASLADWSPEPPLDLLVSNAALQWVAGHARLIPRLANMVAPGGTFAAQIPDFFNIPAHHVIDEAAAQPRWATKLEGAGVPRDSVQPIAWYVHRLIDLGFVVNAWQTTYIHVLRGENPALEWFKGTALAPLLGRLDPAAADDFLRDVGSRMLAAYPQTGEITLLPFPRLFFVASRGG